MKTALTIRPGNKKGSAIAKGNIDFKDALSLKERGWEREEK